MTNSTGKRRSRAARVLAWTLAVLVGLLGLGVWGVDAWFRRKYEPALEQKAAELASGVEHYCAEEALLGADPWFHEPRTEGDAGPLLNAWLPWVSDADKPPPEGSPLALPEELGPRVAALKNGGWLTAKLDLSRLDFTWMTRLLAYNRWDLFAQSPLSGSAPFNWGSAGVPDYILLQQWAKLRLRHGLDTGHPLEAAQEVRHLAWLCLRSEIVLGGAMASSLLKGERMAWASLARPPSNWTPMAAEQIDRLGDQALESAFYSNLAAPPAVAHRARQCATATSRCLAVSEAAFFARLVEPFARRPFAPGYAALDQDLAALPCATPAAREIRVRNVTATDADLQAMTREQATWLRRFPGHWLNDHIGRTLVALMPTHRTKAPASPPPAPARAQQAP